MRFLTVVVLMAAAVHGTSAFTKKRDPNKRPAFSLSSSTSGGSVMDAMDAQGEDTAPNPQPAFVAVQIVNLDDDDAVVGYATGAVACIVSLALGFTLGYGTV